VRCLDGLKKQSRIPDEVLVMVRDADAETKALLEHCEFASSTLRVITVIVPGVVAALNAGLEAARADIIAITDDDAVPRPDWLARINTHFRADPKVGGVGGRDWLHYDGKVDDGARKVVGRVQWFGRVIGNHHLGVGGPREVCVLKGANMSVRRAAIQSVRFDKRLRGTGAQVHNELAFSLAVKRAGWKLIYDPAVAVDHYLAPRFGEEQRDRYEWTNAAYSETLSLLEHVTPMRRLVEQRDRYEWTNAAYNETLSLLEHVTPMRRLVFIIWAVLVGTRASPGLLQWLRFLPREGRLAGKYLRAALTGRIQALNMWRRSR
jgi:cellulose synthase/poly-beta-1,6-N-acetylglucosamine synthase-like glycosyltransferase